MVINVSYFVAYLLVALGSIVYASETLSNRELFFWAGATNSDGRYFSDAAIAQIAKKGLSPGSSRKTVLVVAGFHGQYGTQESIDTNLTKLKIANPNLEIYAYQSMTMIHRSREIMYTDENFNREAWLLRATKNPAPPEVSDFDKGDVLFYSKEKSYPYIDISKQGYQTWLLQKIARLRNIITPDGKKVYSGVFFDNTNAFGFRDYSGNLWRGYQHFSKYINKSKIEALDNAIPKILNLIQTTFPDFKVGFNGFADAPWKENRNSAFYSHSNAMLNEEFCATLSTAEDGNGNIKSPAPIYALFNDIKNDIRVAENNSGIIQMYQMNYLHPASTSITKRVQNYCFGLYLATVHQAHTRYGAGRYRVVATLEHNPRITDFGTSVSDPIEFGQTGFMREFTKGFVLVNVSNATIKIPAPINGMVVRAFNYNGNPKHYNEAELISVAPHQAVFLAKFQTGRFELKEKVGSGCGDVPFFDVSIVPQKGAHGEFVIMGITPFSPVENHWNDTIDRGITDAYRLNHSLDAVQTGYALGTKEGRSAKYPFRLKKAIFRQRLRTNGVITGDCRYELQ